MEKNYEKRIADVKNEVLDEIRDILGYDERHEFLEEFTVVYNEDEVIKADYCRAVEVWFDGMVVFCVSPESNATRNEEEVIEGEEIFLYTAESFIDILKHLKKEVREKKLATLKKLVRDNGGNLKFDGAFEFNILDKGGEEVWPCYLERLYIDDTGQLINDNKFEGCGYTNGESSLIDEDLDNIIDYVRRSTKTKFHLRVSGSFSRCFDIEANSYEEALAMAKNEWNATPLCPEDSNGENWEEYTSPIIY